MISLFDKILKYSGSDYYFDKIEFRYKGTFDIKYYIENFGTFISYYNY